MDWNLRACSRSGHATYAPDETRFRQRLATETPLGEAWRCLRCGCYVPGEPAGHGPGEQAPVLLRGAQLRSAFILRLLAIERFFRGTVTLLLGLAVLQFKTSQVSVRTIFDKDLSAIKPALNQLGWNVTDSGLIHSVEKALNARASTLDAVAVFLLGYGVLQLVEGVGLWLLRRWGEYFAAVATSVFLPLEVYELTEKTTLLRLGALVLNIAAVLYLLLSKRLFGLRGGARAYEEKLHEASLLELQESSAA